MKHWKVPIWHHWLTRKIFEFCRCFRIAKAVTFFFFFIQKLYIFYLLSFHSKNYNFYFIYIQWDPVCSNPVYNQCKSWFMYLLIYFRELLEYRRLVSSAKWCITEYWIALLRWLIYIRNSIRPKTEPCSTPWVLIKTVDSASYMYIVFYWLSMI